MFGSGGFVWNLWGKSTSKRKYYYQKINSEIAVRVQWPQPPTQRTELNPI